MNINYLQCLVEKGQMLKMGIGGSLWLFGHLVFSEGSLMGHLSGPWGPRICWATVPLIQTPPTPSIAFHRHYMSTFAKVAFLSCFVFAYLYLCICIYSFALLYLWFKLQAHCFSPELHVNFCKNAVFVCLCTCICVSVFVYLWFKLHQLLTLLSTSITCQLLQKSMGRPTRLVGVCFTFQVLIIESTWFNFFTECLNGVGAIIKE